MTGSGTYAKLRRPLVTIAGTLSPKAHISRSHMLTLKIPSDLQKRTDQQWEALPDNFRMEGSLKHYERGSWERDFLASTRFNYLHVQFLLRLLCLGPPADPDPAFVSLAQEILSLVVEVIVLRNQLVCSTGTSFEWRVSRGKRLLSYSVSDRDGVVGALWPSSNRYHHDRHAQTATCSRRTPGRQGSSRPRNRGHGGRPRDHCPVN